MAREIIFLEKYGKQVMVTNDRDFVAVGITARGEYTWKKGSSYQTVREMKDGAQPSCQADFMQVYDKVVGLVMGAPSASSGCPSAGSG